jgi:hypothetical protein
MTEYKQYRRKQVAEMRPYERGDDVNGVSISDVDRNAGSPKPGDMIARNPKNHADKWLVAAKYFADNFESVAQYGPGR